MTRIISVRHLVFYVTGPTNIWNAFPLTYPRDIWTLVSLIRLQLPTKLQRLELSLLQCLHHKVYDLKLYCLKQGCANLRKQWTCMRCRVNERKSEVRPKLQKKHLTGSLRMLRVLSIYTPYRILMNQHTDLLHMFLLSFLQILVANYYFSCMF